jgi:hypothetical protein
MLRGGTLPDWLGSSVQTMIDDAFCRSRRRPCRCEILPALIEDASFGGGSKNTSITSRKRPRQGWFQVLKSPRDCLESRLTCHLRDSAFALRPPSRALLLATRATRASPCAPAGEASALTNLNHLRAKRRSSREQPSAAHCSASNCLRDLDTNIDTDSTTPGTVQAAAFSRSYTLRNLTIVPMKPS